MSSFGKNVIPRRIHKERAQPASRIQKHGLLEKKKDYKLRAKDRNQKRLRIKLLREKAAFRNPDEFYYGMINSATDGGRVRRRLNENEKDAIPIANRTRDQRMLAETQDSAYVTLKYTTERGRLEGLKKRIHFVAAAERAPRRHIIFVDNEEEMEHMVQKRIRDQEERERSVREHVQEVQDPESRAKRKQCMKEQAKSYRELQQRVDRHDKLNAVLQDMGIEKTLLSKGRRFKVRSANPETGAPAVFKWQQERRR